MPGDGPSTPVALARSLFNLLGEIDREGYYLLGSLFCTVGKAPDQVITWPDESHRDDAIRQVDRHVTDLGKLVDEAERLLDRLPDGPFDVCRLRRALLDLGEAIAYWHRTEGLSLPTAPCETSWRLTRLREKLLQRRNGVAPFSVVCDIADDIEATFPASQRGSSATGDDVQPARLVVVAGGFEFDGVRHDLRGKPLQVLATFAESDSGRLTADEINAAVWGDEDWAQHATVRRQVSAARKALQLATNDYAHDPLRCVDDGDSLAWQLDLREKDFTEVSV